LSRARIVPTSSSDSEEESAMSDSQSGSEFVGYAVEDGVAWARIEHGKANALSFEVLAALDQCLTLAENDPAVGALCITGKPGFLTGGFDLSVMKSGDPKAMVGLVSDGGALFTRIYASGVPVLVACPGHAVAAGALLCLAADERIGAHGKFQIGLIETQIGMVLPRWAIEFAEERLSMRHFQTAVVGARMYSPVGARDAGFLDVVVEPDELDATTQAAAKAWASLPGATYAGQVTQVRGARIARLEAAIAADRALVAA
jgi:enoyl-CoA hydratase